MDDRVYTCLACGERPVFTNKVSAYQHARVAHAPLLLDCHVDELFQVRSGVSIPVEPADDGPWVCLHLGCSRHERYIDTMKAHIYNGHDVKRNDQQRGVDYASETEALRIQLERRRQADVECSWLALRLASVRGVADFLTECG